MFLFKAKAPRASVGPFVRRICDLTTPVATTSEQARLESRCHRHLPTLLCPWKHEAPVVEEVVFALTKDISDHGIAVTVPQQFQAEHVVVGLWLPEAGSSPWFFLGDVKGNFALGAGFWLLSIQLTEVAHEEYESQLACLRPLAGQLLTPHR